MPFFVFSQTCYLSGYVYNVEDGERIAYADIYQMDDLGNVVQTNTDGFFSFPFPRNQRCSLVIHAFGFQSDTINLLFSESLVINHGLRRTQLPTIEVSARRRVLSPGKLSMPVELLRSVPVLLAEPDVVKTLQLLPGIAGGVEGTTGLFVRGGYADQNLMLLDGSTVYNNGHLFGFLSAFHPNTIRQVDAYKGYFPGKYGGRLSSVIDFTMRDGDRTRHKREKSFGLISSTLTMEGPIKSGKGSYLINGRLAYSGLLTLASLPSYYAGDELVFAGMYDVSAKVSRYFDNGAKLSVSLYLGDDLWGSKYRLADDSGTALLNWGNRVVALRHDFSPKPNRYVVTLVNFNQYANNYTGTWRTAGGGADQARFKNEARLTEWLLRRDYTWHWGQQELSMGLSARIQAAAPSKLTIEGGDSTQVVSPSSAYHYSSAYYVEYHRRLSPRWDLSANLRFSTWHATSNFVPTIEPRVALHYHTQRIGGFHVGYSRNTQFIHQVSINTEGLPYDYWLPASLANTHQTGNAWYVGWDWVGEGWKINIDAYTRLMVNVAEPSNNFLLTSGTSIGEWLNNLYYGTGKAQGIEVLFHKTAGDLQGWLAYTLSNSQRRYHEINGGSWFAHPFDRRHDAAITIQYAMGDSWTLGTNFIAQSGTPVTLPQTAIQTFYGSVSPVYLNRNNARLPVYHRLDIQMTKQLTTRKKQRDASLSFGIYNVYARANPLALSFYGKVTNGFANYQLERSVLFRFIPNINYTVKW